MAELFYDSSLPKKRITNDIKELWQYRDLIWQLTLKNVTVRYKRSFLGILWTLLDPLLTMIVMGFVFSAILNRQIPNFIVYLLCGLVVWNFFSQATSSTIREFLGGERLISKVYLPQAVFILVPVSTGLVNFALSFIALILIAIATQSHTAWIHVIPLVVPIFVLFVFCTGIGMLIAPLNALFSDVENLYGIFLRLLLYFSAIFYSIESMPEWLQAIIRLNPIYHFIAMVRAPIYSGNPIPMDSLVYVSVWAVIFVILGWILFTKLSDKVALNS